MKLAYVVIQVPDYRRVALTGFDESEIKTELERYKQEFISSIKFKIEEENGRMRTFQMADGWDG